jgi:integrase
LSIKKYKDREGNWAWKFDIRVGKYKVDDRRIREKGFQTAEECRDAINAIRTDYKRGKYKFRSDLIDISVEDLKKAILKKLTDLHRSQSTLKQYGRVLTSFSTLYPKLLIESITSQHLNNFYSHRLNLPTVSANTAVDDLHFLVSALKQVKNLFPKLKDWNPPAHEQVKKVNAYRERVISKEEEQAIIASLHDPSWYANDELQRQQRKTVALVFWVALRTGMRIGEILGLKTSSINFNKAPGAPNGWIVVQASHISPMTKNKEVRNVRMTKNLAEALKQKITPSSPYLFASDVKEGFPVRWILRTFRKACERAKVPFGQDLDGGIVFHDTRHTAASRMAQSGIDIKTIGKMLGHGDAFMTMRYLHSSADSELAGMNVLDDEKFSSVQNESNPDTEGEKPHNTTRYGKIAKTSQK